VLSSSLLYVAGSRLRYVANWLRHHPALGGWALLLLPDVTVTTTIPGIGPFSIRVRRNRSFWLRDPLLLERFPLAALRHFVRPGCVAYDVGACIGLYTRLLADYFNAGTVVAFEPMTDNLQQLRRNVDLGHSASKVLIVPYAVANEDGERMFQVDDLSSASGALTSVTGGEAAAGRRQFGFSAKSESVSCRRLDSAVEELGLPAPDVIKVDIEGAEAAFLEGAEICLAEHSPKILLEVHGLERVRNVLQLLSRHGYHCSGEVSRRLSSTGYCKLDESLMRRCERPYDVHYMLAAKNERDLPESLEPFAP